MMTKGGIGENYNSLRNSFAALAGLPVGLSTEEWIELLRQGNLRQCFLFRNITWVRAYLSLFLI